MKKANKPARIGIVGFGNQGSAYVALLTGGLKIGNFHMNLPGIKLVKNGVLGAVCDINPEKLEAQYKKFHLSCPKYTDYKEMIESGNIDAVIVTTPHYFHPEVVIYALEHGLHAMSDKPAGVYTKQVKEMNAVAAKIQKKDPNRLFAIMFNQRTNNAYKFMKKTIAEGGIGELKRFNWIITDWYRSQSYYDSSAWRATWKGEGGGVLFNQAPHQLDLLSWILGVMPCMIDTHCHFGKWHDIEVEDDVTAYMEFPNGATGVFITSTADAPGTNRLEILGTKGKLVTDGSSVEYYKNSVDEREFNKNYKGGFGKIGCSKKTLHFKPSTQHLEIINNYCNAICGLEPLKVRGEEGINGVEVMDAMLLSTWLDKPVSVPIDDDLYLAELDKHRAAGKVKETKDVVLDTRGTY
ncbi:MAG: Gfo/Idh/MocA family oxidoreductase [Clostridia bacterium]|nr:Gfo/Idh/MocA family oxidoreductase [Clostridia bacterium]